MVCFPLLLSSEFLVCPACLDLFREVSLHAPLVLFFFTNHWAPLFAIPFVANPLAGILLGQTFSLLGGRYPSAAPKIFILGIFCIRRSQISPTLPDYFQFLLFIVLLPSLSWFFSIDHPPLLIVTYGKSSLWGPLLAVVSGCWFALQFRSLPLWFLPPPFETIKFFFFWLSLLLSREYPFPKHTPTPFRRLPPSQFLSLFSIIS